MAITILPNPTQVVSGTVSINSTLATPVSVQLSDGTSQPVDLRAYLRTSLAMQIQQLVASTANPPNGFVPLEIPAFLGAL